MATRLVYNGIEFDDTSITSGELIREKSPLSDTLAYDTFDLKVLKDFALSGLIDANNQPLIDANNEEFVCYDPSTNFASFTRGTVGDVYHNDGFLGKYYIDYVKRNSKDEYTLKFISALGLLDSVPFKGDVYARVTAGSIIIKILGGTYVSQDSEFEYYSGRIPFYLQKTLKNTIVSGWIPYTDSSREALQQVLFAVGGSIVKADDGLLKITYWNPSTTKNISSDRLYIGGSIDYKDKVTRVVVTEHEFRQTKYDSPKELYDARGDIVSTKEVVFDKPCYGLFSDTLTILESSANYAIVSGSGILSGYEYTHNTFTLEKNTGASGGDNVATISNAYLVSTLNSNYVLERACRYYGYADQVNYEMVVNGDVNVGDKVSFTDPFGDNVTGFLISEDMGFSNILKSRSKFVKNWTPSHMGNAFNNAVVFKRSDVSSGKITIPSAAVGKAGRFILFSGFAGGNGGFKGEKGQGYSRTTSDSSGTIYYVEEGEGGKGGKAGKGGSGYRALQIDVSSLASTYTASIGEGGVGGAADGGEGQLGGNTTLGSYTTANQGIRTIGMVNAITGAIYGDNGLDGLEGAEGSKGLHLWGQEPEEAKGGDVVALGHTYTGGVGGSNSYFAYGGYAYGCGGGGGGAAYGTNGNNGGGGRTQGIYEATSGGGARGADAQPLPQAQFGYCGSGGNGGGGGGGGGSSYASPNSFQRVLVTPSGDSEGGNGSAGGKGSDGLILLYW